MEPLVRKVLAGGLAKGQRHRDFRRPVRIEYRLVLGVFRPAPTGRGVFRDFGFMVFDYLFDHQFS